ncbi:MAG: 30S ribosomal protein S20 [Planctomycetia bacterium]|nr:30S ribosomal protein S20 [Planctomycetia bacterium]
MPHTQSAKKNLRKSEKRRVRNKAAKRELKTYLKRFQTALSGPVDALQTEYNLTAAKLDRAAAKGIIHRNMAARKKSQLARALFAKKNPKPASSAAPSK